MESLPASTSASQAPPLEMGPRINLSGMMFLQFAVWGAWFVNLANYLVAMKFDGPLIGSVYATMNLGAMLSPIFIGQIADRYFSSERLMAVLHLAGGGVLCYLATITDPTMFYWVTLGYALLYSPTLALSNSIAFTHLPDATRDFPGVRVLGTIGWIAAGFAITGLLAALAASTDETNVLSWSILLGGTRFTLPLLFAGGLSVVLGLWSFFLPHTPPTGKPGDALPFLKAVGLLREPSFAVFYGVSFIITIALAFYYAWTGVFLQHGPPGVSGPNVSSVMAIGQVAEMVLLPFLPFFLNRMGMKWVLALGMLCWGIRYALFAVGSPFPLVLIGVALHGICFDFFLAAGFIHVDNESPKDIRASAQALFGFLTYGAGMFIGSMLSGQLKQMNTTPVWETPAGIVAILGSGGVLEAVSVIRVGMALEVVNWTAFWLVPAAGVLVSLVIFIAMFRGPIKQTQPVEAAEPQAV